MLLDTVLDILEILGILTVLIAVASLILAPGGPKGVIKLIREPPVIPVIGIKQIFAWYGRILIPISLVLMLIFLISAGGIIDQLGTSNWSESEATVIQSEIESETSCSYDESVGYDTCSTRDWLVVTYSYQVGRENYTSDRYTFIDDLDPSSTPSTPWKNTYDIRGSGDPSESVDQGLHASLGGGSRSIVLLRVDHYPDHLFPRLLENRLSHPTRREQSQGEGGSELGVEGLQGVVFFKPTWGRSQFDEASHPRCVRWIFQGSRRGNRWQKGLAHHQEHERHSRVASKSR